MTTQTMVVLIAVLAAIGVVVFFLLRQKRTAQLRRRFGPEYERVVHETGDTRKAEAQLQARQVRVERLHIRRLSEVDAARFTSAWRDVQTRFVDDPRQAIADADRLVGDVMQARGYPVGDFDERVADISVDHPAVVMNYRAARDIAQDHARGRASTEDLRQAMVHYRALFSELLEIAPQHAAATPELVAQRRRP
jgi:hypothetical protein